MMNALLATLLLAGADAEPTATLVRITVRAIAASQGSGEVDSRLAPIASNLASFGRDFRYQGYRLVGERSFELGWDAPGEMELPAKRSIRIIPKHMGPDGRVKVHLELFGEPPEHRSSLVTDYSVPRGGTIFVGGLPVDPKNAAGEVLLIAVTTDRLPLAIDPKRSEVGATGRVRPEAPSLPQPEKR
jgi:hypothetical protein